MSHCSFSYWANCSSPSTSFAMLGSAPRLPKAISHEVLSFFEKVVHAAFEPIASHGGELNSHLQRSCAAFAPIGTSMTASAKHTIEVRRMVASLLYSIG